MKIQKVISINEITKAKDKLIRVLNKKVKYTEGELKYNTPEMLHEADMEWVIEEIQNIFDFDGDEDE